MSTNSDRTSIPRSILLVEDETLLAEAQATALRMQGHEVVHAHCAMEALQSPAHDVVISDVNLPIVSGFELVESLRKRGDTSAVLFTSGAPTSEDYRRAMRLGAYDFLAKPYPLDDLVRAVDEAASANTAAADADDRLDFTAPATPEGAREGARRFSAWLLRHGHGPAARLRAATACSELLAVPSLRGNPEGECRVRARDVADSVTLTIDRPVLASDDGIDPHELFAPAGAVARARALADELSICAEGDRSRVDARFALESTRSQDELADTDYLAPAELRRLLAREKSVASLPPAIDALLRRLTAAEPPTASPLRK